METVFFAHALAARIEREIATRESTSSCAASPRRQGRTTETIIFRRRRAFARVSAPSRADRRLGPRLWLRGGRRRRCRCAGGVCRSETPFRPGRGRCVLNSPFLEAACPAERFGVTAVHKPSACTQHAPRTSAGSHTG